MLKRILISRRGEGYIDVCVLVLCAMLVIALAVQVLPAFIAKQQLNTFATELVREAEIAGRIGPETDRREQALRDSLAAEGYSGDELQEEMDWIIRIENGEATPAERRREEEDAIVRSLEEYGGTVRHDDESEFFE